MQSDKKDIRMQEPILEVRGVLDEIAQLASPILGEDMIMSSPQFEEPIELLGLISRMDDKELSKQVFG